MSWANPCSATAETIADLPALTGGLLVEEHRVADGARTAAV
ncbi:hypothetical protein [Nocardia sp. NPDC004750]